MDPRGIEEALAGSGVSSDIYASFWSEAANSLMIGECVRIPYVRHDIFHNGMGGHWKDNCQRMF